jgi:hypothetical protein
LGWVEDHAHTRLRRHGHIMCVDAEGIVVGLFRQHTSRRLDPQLHTHAVIANRVPASPGVEVVTGGLRDGYTHQACRNRDPGSTWTPARRPDAAATPKTFARLAQSTATRSFLDEITGERFGQLSTTVSSPSMPASKWDSIAQMT